MHSSGDGEVAESAEGGTLLRCCGRKLTVGSNPTLSATSYEYPWITN